MSGIVRQERGRGRFAYGAKSQPDLGLERGKKMRYMIRAWAVTGWLWILLIGIGSVVVSALPAFHQLNPIVFLLIGLAIVTVSLIVPVRLAWQCWIPLFKFAWIYKNCGEWIHPDRAFHLKSDQVTWDKLDGSCCCVFLSEYIQYKFIKVPLSLGGPVDWIIVLNWDDSDRPTLVQGGMNAFGWRISQNIQLPAWALCMLHDDHRNYSIVKDKVFARGLVIEAMLRTMKYPCLNVDSDEQLFEECLRVLIDAKGYCPNDELGSLVQLLHERRTHMTGSSPKLILDVDWHNIRIGIENQIRSHKIVKKEVSADNSTEATK